LIADLQHRVTELRFLEGIEKAEHVPYPTGDQFWVRFNRPLDLTKLLDIVKKHNYQVVKFAGFMSKLPRGLSEMLWNGVTHIVVKKISGLAQFTSSLGFEPEGIAKIASDLHGPYQIFIATNEEGIQLLYEYLGLKYKAPVPPPPPPKPTAVVPAKPVAPPVARPTAPQAPRPVAQAVSPAVNSPPAPPEPPPTAAKPSVTPNQQQDKKDESAQATGS
jgi:hypothetical protein